MTSNVGLTERNVQPASGVAVHSFVAPVMPEPNWIVQPVAIGAANGAFVDYQPATLLNKRLPVPMTLCAEVAQVAPVMGVISVKVRGYDQFGNWQEEVTPYASVLNKNNTFIYLALPFARIESVEYSTDGIDTAATPTFNLGMRPDWEQVDSGTVHHVAGDNMGIGLPFWTDPDHDVIQGWIYTLQSGASRLLTNDELRVGYNDLAWGFGSKDKIGFVFSGSPPQYGNTWLLKVWAMRR